MAPNDRNKVGQFKKRMKRKNPSEASVLFDHNNVLAHMCAGETGESDDCPFDDRTNLTCPVLARKKDDGYFRLEYYVG